MWRVVIGSLALSWSALSWAQTVPNVTQWIGIFQEVRQHALFKDLLLSYAKAAAKNIEYAPVGVIPRAGLDCVVVIAEGDNPMMARIMQLSSTKEITRALLLTIAAHELGHCDRLRSKRMSAELWTRFAATEHDSSERHAMEREVSIEEAYADAYAFAYIQDTQPAQYVNVFAAMHSVRHDPAFSNPIYHVEPLYALLASHGLDVSLPLRRRVEAVMQQAKF